MKNILIHGLGQNHKSWNETIAMIIKAYFLLSLISVTIRKENLIYVDFH